MPAGLPRRSAFPHYIVNFEERFRETVVRNFVDEYAAGRTPIPCVHCNADLKFASLVERAAGLEADAVATGHYARVVFDEDARRYRLLRSADPDKDQTYFLFSLTQDQLAHAMFPVGHLTKAEVRAQAERAGLLVANKPDSHEICFVPDGETGNFVERQLETVPAEGDIVDSAGRSVGRHRGVHRYTVGQRRGLGLSAAVPLYVLKIDAGDSRVVVGPREELGRTALTASRGQLDRGRSAVRASPRDRPHPPPPCWTRRRRSSTDAASHAHGDVRHSAAGRDPGPGGRVL